MTEKELQRLQELRAKDQLNDKEFAQWCFLENKVITDERVKQFRANQQAPYSEKRSRAVNLAWEFFRQVEGQCYVAVGGLDSIVLYLFLRSIGIDVPAVSVSSLEDKSIQKVHKALGVVPLKPLKSKVKVIREFGWPVISKEIAGKIATIQHPTEKNATVRHAIITGETGAQGGYRTGTRMQMKQRWLNLFGGADAEGAALGYAEADFLVSDKCCYYLKEMPCEIYRKESGRWPYMGLMASEGGRREKALAVNGCNYISETTKRSCPFATFSRQDILTLALEMDAWYQENHEMFPGPKLDTIVPAIYGTIERDEKGLLYATDAQRTGCSMCGFGIHMEERPHRFDLLWERNPKEWDFWMNNVVQMEDGTHYGWGHVLDYIGVKWRNPEVHIKAKRDAEAVEQLVMEGI
ncbi:MAG: hypothetical protein J6B95_08325 [Oscillospiraceae bacterium]|nr:hypothetical protein [Oscillospiraceae bacterium]